MALDANFRLNLRKRRRELKMTQAKLAEQLGVSTAYVCQLETGSHTPGLEVIERVAKALDCPALMLLMTPESAEMHIS